MVNVVLVSATGKRAGAGGVTAALAAIVFSLKVAPWQGLPVFRQYAKAFR
jgi:hypothetical protein